MKKTYYGCSRGVPAPLLNCLENGYDPKWYLNYLAGKGDRKLPTPVKKLLAFVKDGRWERRIDFSGVGVGSVMACLEIGLIENKIYAIKDNGNEYFDSRITRKGQIALETGLLPY